MSVMVAGNTMVFANGNYVYMAYVLVRFIASSWIKRLG